MSDSDENRDPDDGQSGVTRGDLLKTAAAGAGVLMGAGAAGLALRDQPKRTEDDYE